MLGHMLLGQRGRDYLEVSFEDVDPNLGGDWYRGIATSVTFSFGSFRGGFGAYLFAGEVRQLLADLQVLSRTTTGAASFSAREKQVVFSAALQPTGSMIVAGELRDNCGMGNRLLFEMGLDQTYLVSPISSLERFVSEHL